MATNQLPYMQELKDKFRVDKLVQEIADTQTETVNVVPWMQQQVVGVQTVVFVGEEHSSGVDKAVAHVVMGNLPLGNNPYVVYERLLSKKYGEPKRNGNGVPYDEEPYGYENVMTTRNAKLCAFVTDAFQAGHDVVYVVCGDEHNAGLRGMVTQKIPNVTWIHKASHV